MFRELQLLLRPLFLNLPVASLRLLFLLLLFLLHFAFLPFLPFLLFLDPARPQVLQSPDLGEVKGTFRLITFLQGSESNGRNAYENYEPQNQGVFLCQVA